MCLTFIDFSGHLGAAQQAVNKTFDISPYKVDMANMLANSTLFTHRATLALIWSRFGVHLMTESLIVIFLVDQFLKEISGFLAAKFSTMFTS